LQNGWTITKHPRAWKKDMLLRKVEKRKMGGNTQRSKRDIRFCGRE